MAPKAKASPSGKSKPTSSVATPRATPEPDDGSRRLAALGYGILILLATPVCSLDTHTADGFKFLQFSPMEVSAMFITEEVPALKPLAQALNLPGTLMKQVSFTLKYCKDGRKDKCSIWPLLDLPRLFEQADVSHLLPIMHKYFSPSSWNLLVGGALAVTFTAMVGLFRPPVRVGVLGFLLMVYAIYITAAANFLPTLLFEAFLGGYVLMYDPAGMKRQAEADRRKAAEKLAKARAARGAGGSTPSSAAATTSQSPAQRRKQTPDRKQLYDI